MVQVQSDYFFICSWDECSLFSSRTQAQGSLSLGLPDVNETYVTKQAVGDAIWKHHYDDLKKEISNSKKLNDIKDEDFSNIQEYFKDRSVENTRMAFKIRNPQCNFKKKCKKMG